MDHYETVRLKKDGTRINVSINHVPMGVKRIDTFSSPTAKLNDSTTGDSVNVDITVIDGGIDKTHPNLNVVGGYNCTSKDTSKWTDGSGHGTHVAGTAAAKDTGTSVVGVAPGARLWSMKVLNNQGWGWTSWSICGIDQVTKQNSDKNADGSLKTSNDIEVANMSLGGSGSDGTCGSNSYHLAICKSVNENNAYGLYPGVLYAVAAGNDNRDLKDDRPATYREVLTVSATADSDGVPGGTSWPTSMCRIDQEETAADFSNFAFGAEDQGHTIAAPGTCILSTKMGGGTTTMSGTSMASPHVAGVAALYRAKYPSAKPEEVKAKLLDDAKTKTGLDPNVFNYYGFAQDPTRSPTATKYYGYLTHAGSY